MCLYQKPHLFSPLVDCFNAKHRCRNTMCNEWTTRSFFHLTLSFNPAAIITCFTNLASLFHCVSKPIAQMFCRVISRNDSWRISVPPAVQIGPVLGVKRKKNPFSFCSWALLWDQSRVWAPKPGMCRITVWLCTVLLCNPVVKSVNPENSCKLLGFEHEQEDLATTFISAPLPPVSIPGKALPEPVVLAVETNWGSSVFTPNTTNRFKVSCRVSVPLLLPVGEEISK